MSWNEGVIGVTELPCYSWNVQQTWKKAGRKVWSHNLNRERTTTTHNHSTTVGLGSIFHTAGTDRNRKSVDGMPER